MSDVPPWSLDGCDWLRLLFGKNPRHDEKSLPLVSKRIGESTSPLLEAPLVKHCDVFLPSHREL